MDSPIPTPDHDLLIEVSTNVKNLASTITAYTDSSNQIIRDHEARIRILESESQQLRGAQKSQKNQMAVIATVFGLISVVLGLLQFINGH